MTAPLWLLAILGPILIGYTGYLIYTVHAYKDVIRRLKKIDEKVSD